MPYFTVESADNIKSAADIAGLLATINATLIGQDGVFPFAPAQLNQAPIE